MWVLTNSLIPSTYVNQSQSTTVVLSSTKNAKKTLEKGPFSGWGLIMNVTEKHSRFGLGYHSASRYPSEKGSNKFNPVRFSSAGYQYDLSVEMMDGASSNKPVVSGFVHKCLPRFKLDNWTSTVVPMVFSEEM